MRFNVNLLRAAARLNTPEQTATAALSGEKIDDHAYLEVDMVEGWSPRPTQDPLIYDLVKRQNDGSLRTCGFIDADRDEPLTCGISSVCVTDKFLGYAGCCDADNVESCNVATECIELRGLTEIETVVDGNEGGDTDSVGNSRTMECSSSCARALLDYSTTIYTQWFCYPYPATVYPTYSNPIRSEDFFSASALPADANVSGDSDNSGNNDNTNEGGFEDNESGSEGGDNAGAIAGGIVGGLAVLSIAGLLAWWLPRRRREKHQDIPSTAAGPEPIQKPEMPATNEVNLPNVSPQGSMAIQSVSNEICTDSTIPPIRHELSPNTATSINAEVSRASVLQSY